MSCITQETRISDHIDGIKASGAVLAARADVIRDLQKVCSGEQTDEKPLHICLKKTPHESEQFSIQLSSDESELLLSASDDLGFIYGLYHISRELLGVSNFWFWNDQPFTARPTIPVSQGYRYESTRAAVRYRGWFINDEILIDKWQVEGRSDLPWIMAFEALLRSGGNMVIPGTDRNSRLYRSLAASRGLYITHHHAEPLGAEMFIRARPDLEPSYALHPEVFHQLWRESIAEQKDTNVIWNLGFRGQGDYPFWHNDPSYDTDEKRGALVSSLIKMQYDFVKEAVPDAVCCTNLYGEVMELYQKGCLSLPDEIIKIWADNGFGKMVSRRQGNHNPRVSSMPEKDYKSRKGIYYHVSFFDLQAANHLTMLSCPAEMVCRELAAVLENGGSDYWIINCSNIKPHVYFLDLIAELWNNGCTAATAEAICTQHRTRYAERYYGEVAKKAVAELISAYADCAPQYGPNEDDRAGEQFSNYGTRNLLSQYMKNAAEPAKNMFWAFDAHSLKEQAEAFSNVAQEAAERYHTLRIRAEGCTFLLKADSDKKLLAAKTLLEDSLLLQVRLHEYCYTGAAFAMQALLHAFSADYKQAFYLAGKAKDAFTHANEAMREREHGKWRGFYANDCFSDLKTSARLAGAFMAYVRNQGDGPDFYRWQREFTYSDADRNVVTLLLWENRLDDDELYQAMKARFEA